MPGILSGMKAAGASLGKARGSIEIDTHDLDRVTQVVHRVGQDIARSFQDAMKGVRQFTAGVKELRTEIMAIGVAGGLVTGLGLGAAKDVRNYRVAFRQILGDEEQAVAVMDKLTKSANEFGIEVTEVWQMARALLPVLKGGSDELDAWVKRAALLSSINPLKATSEASRSIQEYLSGQTISMQRIFNIDPKLIQEAQQQYSDLGEQMDYILTRMGATEEGARAMANAWTGLRNELTLALSVGFTPLFNVLQVGAFVLRGMVSRLSETHPELLMFGAALATIAVVGAPTLLFLQRMISLVQTLKTNMALVGALTTLGKVGILGGVAYVGAQAGMGIAHGIGQATGNKDMEEATWEDLSVTLRQALFLIANELMKVSKIITLSLMNTASDFKTAVGGMIVGMGKFVQQIGEWLPDALGGKAVSLAGANMVARGNTMQVDAAIERENWPAVIADGMRTMELALLGWLNKAGPTDLAGKSNATTGPGGFSTEQAAAVEEWAQNVQAIEEAASAQRLQITRAYEQQRSEIIASYGRTIARDAEDWAREQARAWSKLQSDIAAVRESAAEREAGWQADMQERVGQIRSEGARRIEEMYEEHQINLERLQRDHRDRLLEAASRLDARAVAEEQRRFRTQSTEMGLDLQRRVQQEHESLNLRIQQEQEGYAKRLEEGRIADERRIRDLQDSYREQQALQAEDRQIRLQRMAEDHQMQLAQLARSNADQLRAIEVQKQAELSALNTSFLRQMSSLGYFTNAWEAIQRMRQERSVSLFGQYWDQVDRITVSRMDALQRSQRGVIGGRAAGGPVSETGTYMLHGTPGRPEYVLSAATVASLRGAIGGPFTQRQLVGAVQGPRGGGFTMAEGAVQMSIYATPGMDARAVAVEVERRMYGLFERMAGRG
jgi:hypothetical protein